MTSTSVFLLLLLSAIWGSSFIFIRYLAPLIGPVATADFRMFLAGVALVLFFLATRFKPDWKKNWKHFIIIGIANSALPFVLYSAAALVLPASMEAIFNSLSPMFGALFASLWLDERLTARKITGLVLGVAGVVTMSSLAGLAVSPSTFLALAACILAPMCYGLAGVYIKKRAAAAKPMAVAGGSQLMGGLVLMPFLLISPPSPSAFSPVIIALVIAFALLCSAVAYIIYYRLIADVGPTRALTVTFLIPVFAMGWSYLLLGEAVTWSMALGAAIILAGTYLVAAKGRRQSVKAAAMGNR